MKFREYLIEKATSLSDIKKILLKNKFKETKDQNDDVSKDHIIYSRKTDEVTVYYKKNDFFNGTAWIDDSQYEFNDIKGLTDILK